MKVKLLIAVWVVWASVFPSIKIFTIARYCCCVKQEVLRFLIVKVGHAVNKYISMERGNQPFGMVRNTFQLWGKNI